MKLEADKLFYEKAGLIPRSENAEDFLFKNPFKHFSISSLIIFKLLLQPDSFFTVAVALSALSRKKTRQSFKPLLIPRDTSCIGARQTMSGYQPMS